MARQIARWLVRTPVLVALAGALLLSSVATLFVAEAQTPGNPAFQRTWERTDKPVMEQRVSRTWMWGPSAFTGVLSERYDNAPGQQRLVQYFDKSRMEINHDPSVPADSPWHVTNGLLVVEMMTGRVQVGDSSFLQRDPARISVAGDPMRPTDMSNINYWYMGLLRNQAPEPEGAVINKVLTPGAAGRYYLFSDELGARGIHAVRYVPETQHTVAGPFWDFMNSAGSVYENGDFRDSQMFLNPFYATGFPVTEAYWANVSLAGKLTAVLIQCFERRCLTYTPSNSPGWQVEAGNVGRHYYEWRQQVVDQAPTPVATSTTAPTSTPTTATGARTSTPHPTNTPIETPTEVWLSEHARSGPMNIEIAVPAPVPYDPEAMYEYVVFVNMAPWRIALEGWTLSNSSGVVYTFSSVRGSSLLISPGERVLFHTCSPVYPYPLDARRVVDGICRPLFDNQGDTVTLRDFEGKLIASYEIRPGMHPIPEELATSTPTYAPEPTATWTPSSTLTYEPAPTDTPEPTWTATPTSSPTASPVGTTSPLAPPLTLWYLAGEGGVIAMLDEMCGCRYPRNSNLVLRANQFPFMYNLITVPIGEFNADTTGYEEWLRAFMRRTGQKHGVYPEYTFTSDQLFGQIFSTIYEPRSDIGQRIRAIEIGTDPVFAPLGITGPSVYWVYLFNPAWNVIQWSKYDEIVAWNNFVSWVERYRSDLLHGRFDGSFGDFLAHIRIRVHGYPTPP